MNCVVNNRFAIQVTRLLGVFYAFRHCEGVSLFLYDPVVTSAIKCDISQYWNVVFNPFFS